MDDEYKNTEETVQEDYESEIAEPYYEDNAEDLRQSAQGLAHRLLYSRGDLPDQYAYSRFTDAKACLSANG